MSRYANEIVCTDNNRSSVYRYSWQTIASSLLALVLILGLSFPSIGLQTLHAYAADSNTAVLDGGETSLIADGNSANEFQLIFDGSDDDAATGARYAGRIWSDKTAFTTDGVKGSGTVNYDETTGFIYGPDNSENEADSGSELVTVNESEFINVLSTVGSTQEKNEPTPVDLSILIDTSLSMGIWVEDQDENGNPSGTGNTRIQKTVDALNRSLDEFMDANDENRVAFNFFGTISPLADQPNTAISLEHYTHNTDTTTGAEIPFFTVMGYGYRNGNDTQQTFVAPDAIDPNNFNADIQNTLKSTGFPFCIAFQARDSNNQIARYYIANWGINDGTFNGYPPAGTYPLPPDQNPNYPGAGSLINNSTKSGGGWSYMWTGGDTNMQAGLWNAFNVLAQEPVTTYETGALDENNEPVAVTRKPAVFILSDGGTKTIPGTGSGDTTTADGRQAIARNDSVWYDLNPEVYKYNNNYNTTASPIYILQSLMTASYGRSGVNANYYGSTNYNATADSDGTELPAANGTDSGRIIQGDTSANREMSVYSFGIDVYSDYTSQYSTNLLDPYLIPRLESVLDPANNFNNNNKIQLNQAGDALALNDDGYPLSLGYAMYPALISDPQTNEDRLYTKNNFFSNGLPFDNAGNPKGYNNSGAYALFNQRDHTLLDIWWNNILKDETTGLQPYEAVNETTLQGTNLNTTVDQAIGYMNGLGSGTNAPYPSIDQNYTSTINEYDVISVANEMFNIWKGQQQDTTGFGATGSSPTTGSNHSNVRPGGDGNVTSINGDSSSNKGSILYMRGFTDLLNTDNITGGATVNARIDYNINENNNTLIGWPAVPTGNNASNDDNKKNYYRGFYNGYNNSIDSTYAYRASAIPSQDTYYSLFYQLPYPAYNTTTGINGLQLDKIGEKAYDLTYPPNDSTDASGSTINGIPVEPTLPTQTNAYTYFNTQADGADYPAKTIYVTKENIINNINYVDQHQEVHSSNDGLENSLMDLIYNISYGSFQPIEGDNEDGFVDTMTFSDELGPYTTLTSTDDGAVKIDSNSAIVTIDEDDTSGSTTVEFNDGDTYDMAMLMYGQVYGLSEYGVYDGVHLPSNGKAEEEIEGTTYLSTSAASQMMPDYKEGDDYNFNEGTIYTFYEFDNIDTPIYNPSTEFDSNGDLKDDAQSFTLSRFSVWTETAESKYTGESAIPSTKVYYNLPNVALPLQVVSVNANSDDEPVSYATNLDDVAATSPIRLIYGVTLAGELYAANATDDEPLIDLTKIDDSYYELLKSIIGDDYEPGSSDIYFYSNLYTGNQYNSEDPDSSADGGVTVGDVTSTFSPSDTNRYYIYQKMLPLYTLTTTKPSTGVYDTITMGAGNDAGNPAISGTPMGPDGQPLADATDNTYYAVPVDDVLNDMSSLLFYIPAEYFRPTELIDDESSSFYGLYEAEKQVMYMPRYGWEFGSGVGGYSQGEFLCWYNMGASNTVGNEIEDDTNYAPFNPSESDYGKPTDIEGENWVIATQLGGIRSGNLRQNVVSKEPYTTSNDPAYNPTQTAETAYVPTISASSSLSTGEDVPSGAALDNINVIVLNYLGNNARITAHMNEQTGQLLITKQVTPEEGAYWNDPQPFEFTITMMKPAEGDEESSPFTDPIEAQIMSLFTAEDGSVSWIPNMSSTDDEDAEEPNYEMQTIDFDEQGQATVKIMPNEGLLLQDVPEGFMFTVDESPADGTEFESVTLDPEDETYLTSDGSKVNGTIQPNKTLAAHYVNTFFEEPVTGPAQLLVTKQVTPLTGVDWAALSPFNFTIHAQTADGMAITGSVDASVMSTHSLDGSEDIHWDPTVKAVDVNVLGTSTISGSVFEGVSGYVVAAPNAGVAGSLTPAIFSYAGGDGSYAVPGAASEDSAYYAFIPSGDVENGTVYTDQSTTIEGNQAFTLSCTLVNAASGEQISDADVLVWLTDYVADAEACVNAYSSDISATYVSDTMAIELDSNGDTSFTLAPNEGLQFIFENADDGIICTVSETLTDAQTSAGVHFVIVSTDHNAITTPTVTRTIPADGVEHLHYLNEYGMPQETPPPSEEPPSENPSKPGEPTQPGSPNQPNQPVSPNTPSNPGNNASNGTGAQSQVQSQTTATGDSTPILASMVIAAFSAALAIGTMFMIRGKRIRRRNQ